MNKPESVLPASQYRLSRFQVLNWGTFDGFFDIPIASKGFIFMGHSGSGKSTLLDAHTCLLSAPSWVRFNQAAKESRKDRDLVSYVRGAHKTLTDSDSQQVLHYHRTGATWSAILEQYRNADGICVTLAQIFWINSRSVSIADISRLYVVMAGELSIKEMEEFARGGFDKRQLQKALPGALLSQKFSDYQERAVPGTQ
jgi:uncharacterized protein YPO0396